MGKSFVRPIKITDLEFNCANKIDFRDSFKYNKDSDSQSDASMVVASAKEFHLTNAFELTHHRFEFTNYRKIRA